MTTYTTLICLNCRHYDIEKSLDQDGYFCPAFPDGIPLEIEDGTDNHRKARPDQQGDFVFTSKFDR